MSKMKKNRNAKTKKSVEKYYNMINVFVFLLCRVLSGLHFSIREGQLRIIALPKPKVLSIEEIRKNDSGNAITLITKDAIEDENKMYNIPIIAGSAEINDVSDIVLVWNTMMLNQVETIIKHGITFLGMSFQEVSELESQNIYLLSDKNTAEAIKNESEEIARAIKEIVDRDFEHNKKQIALAIELNEPFIINKFKSEGEDGGEGEATDDNESYGIEVTVAEAPSSTRALIESISSIRDAGNESDIKNESDIQNESEQQDSNGILLEDVEMPNKIAYAMSKLLDIILLLDPNIEKDYKIVKSNIGDFGDDELGNFIYIYNKLFILTLSFILTSPIIYYFLTNGTEQLSIEITNEELKNFIYESMYRYVFYYKLFQKYAYMHRDGNPIVSEFGYFD